MILGEDKWLLFTGRHFWNRKCRKKTWWQQEFAVASHLIVEMETPVDDCNHRGSVLYWTYDCSKNVVVYIMFRWQQIYGRGEGR